MKTLDLSFMMAEMTMKTLIRTWVNLADADVFRAFFQNVQTHPLMQQLGYVTTEKCVTFSLKKVKHTTGCFIVKIYILIIFIYNSYI